MKALRLALEELEVENQYKLIEESITGLQDVAEYVERQEGGSGISMESIFQSFQEPDYLTIGKVARYRAAMEEHSAGVWAIIIAAAIAIGAALQKIISWAFGGSGGDGSVTTVAANVEATAKVIEQQEPKVQKLNDTLKQKRPEVPKKDPVPDQKPATPAAPTAHVEMITVSSLDDVFEKLGSEAEQHNAGFNWMKRPDLLSLDIMENGEFMKLLTDVVKFLRSGKMNLVIDEFKEVNKMLEEGVDNISESHVAKVKIAHDHFMNSSVSSGKTFKEAMVELNVEYGHKSIHFSSKPITLTDFHKKMATIMRGSITQLSGHVSETEKLLRDYQKSSETIKKSAEEAQKRHESIKEGNEHHVTTGRVHQMMQMLSTAAKEACWALRFNHIAMKLVLARAHNIQAAGNLTLSIVEKKILPVVADDSTRAEVKEMVTQIRADYKKYELH